MSVGAGAALHGQGSVAPPLAVAQVLSSSSMTSMVLLPGQDLPCEGHLYSPLFLQFIQRTAATKICNLSSR